MASSVIKVSSECCASGSRLGIPQYGTRESDPSDLELNFSKVHVERHRFVPRLSQTLILNL